MAEKKEVNEEEDEKRKMALFEHETVPSHRIMNEEETMKVLSKYGITKASLPKILKRDPCIKALKGKVGDVIEIKRKSQTAGETLYYRVVVID